MSKVLKARFEPSAECCRATRLLVSFCRILDTLAIASEPGHHEGDSSRLCHVLDSLFRITWPVARGFDHVA